MRPKKSKGPGPHRYRPRRPTDPDEPDWVKLWRQKQGNLRHTPSPEADRFWRCMIGLDDDDDEETNGNDVRPLEDV